MADGSDPRTSGPANGPGAADRQGSRGERTGGERKERVLHTRVSEQLAEDLRRAAEEMRVPVSNLVRNVLEEAFTVVETVTDNVGGWIEEVIEEADRARDRIRRRSSLHHRSRRQHRRRWHGPTEQAGADQPETGFAPEPEPAVGAEPAPPTEVPPFPEVLGWQLLVLNAPRACAADGRPLARGERAFVGLTSQGVSQTFLCGDCLDRLG